MCIYFPCERCNDIIRGITEDICEMCPNYIWDEKRSVHAEDEDTNDGQISENE